MDHDLTTGLDAEESAKSSALEKFNKASEFTACLSGFVALAGLGVMLPEGSGEQAIEASKQSLAEAITYGATLVSAVAVVARCFSHKIPVLNKN